MEILRAKYSHPTKVGIRPVESISAEATLLDAINILAAKKIGLLIVTGDEGRLAGVISERDIIRAISNEEANALTMQVKSVMTADVITCRPRENPIDVLATMGAKKIRHMPVIENRKIVGLITAFDILLDITRRADAEEQAMLWMKFSWG